MKKVVYQAVSKDAAAYARILHLIWEQFGRPEDCSNTVGWKMMDAIVDIWIKGWPAELQEFIDQNKIQLGIERDVHAAVKADGGYFPLSYPERLFQLIKTLLPKQKLNDKKFIKKFTTRYKVFKATNYNL